MAVRMGKRGFIVACALSLAACGAQQPELKAVDYVDLDRFMGDWYVIANIPTFPEKGAHNAVETYAMNDDGTIATTFVFRDGAFDGKRKEHNPKGFVRDTESNAVWGMRFVWPIKADYRIVYLAEDYSQTIIGRNKRDFVWIMARSPQIPESDYRKLVQLIGSMGYDTSKIEKVPQQW
ncbi:MAG: lipocalin family protein [Gammaproteobacteria bacterium]|nr:lipocalin family protein [Gammaproteobacteria bacterium]MDH4254025.1 lipocalin family protein [Gammaproteobacteria bacterium]MDH5310324.1 lipocalin family protein [Gammaproteobacteria bacterium]